MFITEVLEARRSPEKSVREVGHDTALAWLKKIPDDKIDDYGVRMSELPKLGVNPGSKYNTPVGIYFYPARYYVEIKDNNEALPFVDDAPYIQIVKLISDNTLNISQINASNFGNYIVLIFKKIPTLINAFNIVSFPGEPANEELTKELTKWVSHAPSEALKANLYGGRVWYILFELTKWLAESSTSTRKTSAGYSVQASRESVVWNKMIRTLGFDSVIDTGNGIIHKNEESQGFALDAGAIQLVKLINNFDGDDIPATTGTKTSLSYKPKKIETPNILTTLLKSKRPPDEWIPFVYRYFLLKGIKLEWVKAHQHIVNVVVNRVLDYVKKDPSLLSKVPPRNLDWIVKISGDDPKVKQALEKRPVVVDFDKFAGDN